ncbi:hypothetical protein N7456_003110 [Penicillium angulare]|uniref:Inhibitor I9 domain-containing protein n=1 Tax=Penicillium angulare TaxID=116970 RepID=A0A9W9FU29_9EURO|nr:hypothetical protein N7456_003110 [Penicillium angulare]
MPNYIVKCRDGASEDDIKAVKSQVEDQGGKVTHDYSLIKGFAVEFPDDLVSTFSGHPHVEYVEADGEATTQ